MTAYLVRRVNSPSGLFLGLLLGAMDLTYFQNFYTTVSADGMSVTMLREDGAVLAAHPAIPETDDKMPMSAPCHDTAKNGQDVCLSPGMFDRPTRLVSVHALDSYPIVVEVGMSYAQITAAWKSEAIVITAGAFCAVTCVCLLVRTLALQLYRLESSEESLVTQNRALSAAHERLQAQAAALSVNQLSLSEKSAALEMTLETMDQGLLTVDPNGRVTIHNRRVVEMLELPEDFLAKKPLYSELIAYQQAIGDFDVSGQHIPLYVSSGMVPGQRDRYERLRPNGRSLEVQSIPFANGGMVRTFTDITDRRRSEEQVRYFARHDGLTKLSNRMVFHERLQQALELADRTSRKAAVVCLDLDRFKLVNDTRGHGVGDKLLAEVSARLRSAVRDIDTVARMGGDEFALVLPLVDQPENAEVLAARLLELISAPYEIDGVAALIGVSVGISLYPAHGANAEELLRNADIALYRAKADGRGVWRLFQPLMETEKSDAFQLEQDLRRALSRNELHLAYQPIIDTESGVIVSYEALMRWNHPTRGAIGPSEFIPLAERSGSVVPMGLWALETACEQAASWRDGVRISVNLSPVQFRQGDLVGQVGKILARTGLIPDRLSLEVTEGLLLDGSSATLEMMQGLRALGIRLSLDDFGTAHAGLSYLRCFPFDTIKIDKSFIQDAVTRPEARAIVNTLLEMGKVLKLDVIAEGVETDEQLELLRGMRCPQIQGYLIGRPMPASDIVRPSRIRGESGVLTLQHVAA